MTLHLYRRLSCARAGKHGVYIDVVKSYTIHVSMHNLVMLLLMTISMESIAALYEFGENLGGTRFISQDFNIHNCPL